MKRYRVRVIREDYVVVAVPENADTDAIENIAINALDGGPSPDLGTAEIEGGVTHIDWVDEVPEDEPVEVGC